MNTPNTPAVSATDALRDAIRTASKYHAEARDRMLGRWLWNNALDVLAALATPQPAEATAEDAARYRWLRHEASYSIRCLLFGYTHGDVRHHTDGDLDALIDRARTAGKGEA